MPHGIYTETDIPSDQLDITVAILKNESDPPTNVQTIKQPNGMYTVIATWPDGSDTAAAT